MDFLHIVLLVAGVVTANAIARIGFGFDGIIPSAIAGAVGALLGTLVYELIRGVSRKKDN